MYNDSDEEDEDYVPPDEDDNDDSGKVIANQDCTAVKEIQLSKQKAVDAAFSDLFGGSSATISTNISNKKSRKKTAIKSKNTRKKHQLLSDIFGHSNASKMIIRSKPRSITGDSSRETGNRRNKPLQGIAKKVITETKVFAGQKIEIKRSVLESSSASNSQNGNVPNSENKDGVSSTTANHPKSVPQQQNKVTGIDAVLSKIAGPEKISTMYKTSADWENFKDKTGLDDELKKKAESNDAYLVKKDFLDRVDLRRFEQEKEERNKKRSAAAVAAAHGGK